MQEKLKAEEEESANFEPREMPNFKPVEVKLNTAAILKEAKYITEKKEEEQRYMK